MSDIYNTTFGDTYHCSNCKENVIVPVCSKRSKPEDLKCPKCGRGMIPGITSDKLKELAAAINAEIDPAKKVSLLREYHAEEVRRAGSVFIKISEQTQV